MSAIEQFNVYNIFQLNPQYSHSYNPIPIHPMIKLIKDKNHNPTQCIALIEKLFLKTISNITNS